MRAGCPQQRTHPRFPIGRLQGGAGRLPAAANAPKILNCMEGFKAVRAGCPQQRLHPRFPVGCGQVARSSERTQDSQLEGFKAVRAGCPQQRTHPRFPIGRLQGGAGRLPAAANAPNFPIGRLQDGAGRLPAAASAPKIPNWKASRRCGQATRSSERTQDFQLEGFKVVRAGCPQQRSHPIKIPNWKASRRCGQVARSSERTQDSQLEGFKAVRAGCPQQRTHPRFSIGRLQGGAGRLPAAANAPKIPNWKASRRRGQVARSSECAQLPNWKAPRRCRQAARSSDCTQDSPLEGFKAVRAGCPQQRMHPRFSIRRLQGGAQRAYPRFSVGRLQVRAGLLLAAADAQIPDWKASRRCGQAARSSDRTQLRFAIGRLQGGAGRLPAAANAPKIPNWKASRRCGQAARSSERTQDSQLEGFKAVRAGCPQQRLHPRFPVGCGQVARSSECTRDSQLEGFKAVRAGCPQQRTHPRFAIGRLQGSAGRLPAAANAPNIPNCGRLQGGAGRQPAAVTAYKIPHWKDSRRCGQAARSSECTQDSQLEGFKAVRAGCPQQRAYPRFSAGRLQGGAGLLPAAANAQIPDWKASRRWSGCPQQRTHRRFPFGRLQGGAGRLSAVAKAPKTPNWKALTASLFTWPSCVKHESRSPTNLLCQTSRAGIDFQAMREGKNWKASRRCGQVARSSERTQDSQLEGLKAVRASCPQQRPHTKFPIGRLQGGAGRLPAAASAPKIPNWKASRRCGQAARSSERTQDSQFEGFQAVWAGCPQQRAHPRFSVGRLQGGAGRLPAAANASRQCGQATRSSDCTQDSSLDGLKAVRAGCPQQRMQARFAIGRLQGGAGRLLADANAPKIPS